MPQCNPWQKWASLRFSVIDDRILGNCTCCNIPQSSNFYIKQTKYCYTTDVVDEKLDSNLYIYMYIKCVQGVMIANDFCVV